MRNYVIMYLKIMKEKSGRIRLAIYESYWNGAPKNRIVKTLGFVDELECEHKDPIAWGKEVAKQMTEAKKTAEQAVSIEIHPQQKIAMNGENRKNIGCAATLSLYCALGIAQALRAATKDLKIEFDTNAVLRLLVCERILNPGSKLAAWENRKHYFFRTEFSDDDVYRALDAISEAKTRIVSAMNRRISEAGIRDLSAVYYDVTNYYFEIDKEDASRRLGVCKEHRPNPIVQMGLLQDERGIPLAYRLFPGNTLDCQTMIPVLENLKADYGLERVVTVADKGLNCSQNIAAAVGSGNGFVFSQSIRGTKSDACLRNWVLKETDYVKFDDFKIKSKQGYKTIHLKEQDTSTGEKKDVDVEVKYVAFWSKKYARRAAKEREKVIEKAKNLIENPGAYTRATSHGAAAYVKNLHFDKKTGEIVTTHTLSLDEDAIKQAAALDGYYLIVTSETSWSDAKILDTYRELWRIEETFKVTKTTLKTRPVYVRTQKHIEAHFLTCYISLVILRLLQLKTGLTCAQIQEELAAMNGTNVDANWWVFNHRTKNSDKIAEALDFDTLKLKNLKTGDIKKLLAKAAKAKLL